MNKQDLILEYIEYGFSQEDIAKKLDTTLILVKSALSPNNSKIQAPAKSRIWRTCVHRDNRTIRLYELLYKYGPTRINYLIRKRGVALAALELNVTMAELCTLKVHFGYHRPLPLDAINRSPYFSDIVRKKIYERDRGHCVRCNGVKNVWYYHKIYHPGPNDLDNAATMCRACFIRINRYYKQKKSMFKNLNTNQFKE